MNLQKFITASLIMIQAGIEDANHELQDKTQNTPFHLGQSNNTKEKISISFDLAVTPQEIPDSPLTIEVISCSPHDQETKGPHETISRLRFKVIPN